MWFYKFIKIIAYIPMSIIFPTKIINRKKLPKGKCILASNHISGWDPIILTLYSNREIVFMAKASLFKNWLFRLFFNAFHFVPANRDGKDFTAIKTAIRRLDEGHAFGLFPEGTRGKEGEELLSFKNGASIFAVKAKAVIYPVILKKKPRPFKMNYIYMGDPIDFSEFYDQKLTSAVIDATTKKLEGLMRNNQAQLNSYLEEKYPKKFKKANDK